MSSHKLNLTTFYFLTFSSKMHVMKKLFEKYAEVVLELIKMS